jgi:hypothetical protein
VTKPPDDLKSWSKNNLVREVQRLRALTREMAESRGDDPRPASTQDPIIGGSPHGRGDALVDARAAVLLEGIDVVLVDSKQDTDPVFMLLALRGRINYANDRVEHAYLLSGDGAAGIVSELVAIASRAAGAHGVPGADRFAEEFKVELERRMNDAP